MFKPKIERLSDNEIHQLQELSHIPKYQLRSKIVFFSNLGYETKEIAVLLNCNIWTVWKCLNGWRKRKLASFNL